MNELRDWEISQEERMRSFKYWPFKKGPCRPEKVCCNFNFISKNAGSLISSWFWSSILVLTGLCHLF